MLASLLRSVFLLSCLSFITFPDTVAADGRIAPRHSFQPPNQRTILNWNTGAGAYVNTSYVRLTPAKQSRTGYLWNAFPVSFSDWLVEFEFKAEGLRNIGGDGFAFWFAERSEMLGAVYGSTDFWTGLGIMFDTFNNDNLGSSPLISAVYNDGTQRYDYASDGASQALNTCSFDFRNLDDPAAARIRYEDKKLTVEISISRDRDGKPRYQHCMIVDKVELGVDKYFGLTAHTGDVADNHDIYSFNTYDLSAADVDLAKVRASYAQTLQQQHSQPDHQQMTQEDFQHTVLTMLSQMQEEVNLIQMTELHISDWIYQQEEKAGTLGVAGVRPGGTPETPRGSQSPQDLTQLTRTAEDSVNKLNSLSDLQTSLLREVKQISQQVSSLSNTRSGPSGSSGYPTQTQAVDNSQLTNQIKTASDSISQLTRKVDDQMNALKSDVGRMQQSVNGLFSAVSSGSTGTTSGDLGWISYLMLSFTTFCVASLTYHTFTQHWKNQRYKMI